MSRVGEKGQTNKSRATDLGSNLRSYEGQPWNFKALNLEPDTLDFMYALADFYMKRGNLSEARALAEQMVSKHPGQRIGHELLQHLDRNR